MISISSRSWDVLVPSPFLLLVLLSSYSSQPGLGASFRLVLLKPFKANGVGKENLTAGLDLILIYVLDSDDDLVIAAGVLGSHVTLMEVGGF